MNKKIIQAGFCLCLCLMTARSQASNQEEQPVVIFNNTRIYKSDILMGEALQARKQKELDAEAFNRYEFELRMQSLANLIHQHILNRILAENGYELTDAEYKAYLNYVKNMRNNPYKNIDEKKKIQIQTEIRNWHFDSIIYKKYGGKVVSSAHGLKPVEAYKIMIDELMTTNVLIIPDIMHRGVLSILYTYFEDRNKDYVSEKKAQAYFQQPNWGDFGVKDLKKTVNDSKKTKQN